MGTDKSSEEKLDWMRMMRPKIKDEKLLLRTFIVRFSSTIKTAKEKLDAVKDGKLLDRRLKYGESKL